jgi:hypothetical protein
MKSRKKFAELPPALVNSLRKDSMDWLISCVDPFHDFEHPIEGAPDHVCSKSFVRRHNASYTVSCTADDDNIAVWFGGHHGTYQSKYYSWGTDGICNDLPAAGTEMWPIMIMRSTLAQGPPNLIKLISGTTTLVNGVPTALIADIPSRLIALGIEIVDVTPSLYRKGTLYCSHANGEVEHGSNMCLDRTAVTPLEVEYGFYMKPPTAWSVEQHCGTPGAYIGPLAKGLYTAARMQEIQPPRRTTALMDGASAGSHTLAPVIQSIFLAAGTDDRVAWVAPTVEAAAAVESLNFYNRLSWGDSGFQPLSILCTGCSVETVLQITIKATVEYFPAATHLFELGLATYSPSFDPQAFVVYHDILRSLPYGVPVGENAAGDYWRKVVRAAKVAVSLGLKVAPAVLTGAEGVAMAAGQPEVAAVLAALNTGISAAKAATAGRSRRRPPLPPRRR